MNRPIKFRVWNTREKKFFYQADQRIDIALEYWELNKHVEWPQQYTGLKDKNNKEIYEGDIVQYDGECDITYRKAGIVSIGQYFTHAKEFYHFGVRVKRLDMDSYFGLNLKESENYTIIGNIYETPDLLK